MLCTRCIRTASARQRLPLLRQFSASAQSRAAEPKLSTPVTDAGAPAKESSIPRSICTEGTVLAGLNYNKGGQDPVAKKDEEYPEWLWSCLDVMKKGADAADENAGDEFCMLAQNWPRTSFLDPFRIHRNKANICSNSQIQEAAKVGGQAPEGPRGQASCRRKPRCFDPKDSHSAPVD